VQKRVQRQQINKQYIDQYLAKTIERLAIDTLNQKPNVPAAFMRDNLIGVEHINVETNYTSVRDLKAIREEVTALRLRTKLLSQIWNSVKSLNLDYYRV